MEAVFSAVVGELIARLMSSMIRRYTEPITADEKLGKLWRSLLRAHTIVDEAAMHAVTNEAMLLQLKNLLQAMYRGHYVLDTFKYRMLTDAGAKEKVMYCNSFVMPSSNLGHKRPRLGFGCDDAVDELKAVLASLQAAIGDMGQFVKFLRSYPRLVRQPYSTYLVVDNCMFGRQMERDGIINFLLRKELPRSTPGLDILPVIGRRGVGKRTLVNHVCNDERVRDLYPLVTRLSGDAINTQMVIEHFSFPARCRTLLIIELDGDVDEATWRRFYSLCSSAEHIANGSKIIITSVTDKILPFATTASPIRLNYLPPEEYWYFFKTRSFGVANPDDHPQLASVAMTVARELRGSFMYANMYAGLMRANLDGRFWRRLLESLRNHMRQHLVLFDKDPMDLIGKNHPSYVHPIGGGQSSHRDEVYLLYDYYSIEAKQMEWIPQVSVQDLIVGRDIPKEERFQVLGWRSPIPPYYCYLATCQKQTLARGRVVRRKVCERSVN